ncbi:MAG: putative LPS assembly protein LptD [Bacteroidia bacterium]
MRIFILLFFLTFVCVHLNAQNTLPPDSTLPNPFTDSLKVNNDTTGVVIIEQDSLNKDSANVALSGELKSKIHYLSVDSMEFDLVEDKVYMYHNASIEYEDLKLKADYIEIDFDKRLLYAKGAPDSAGVIVGQPEFEQGQEKFKSEGLTYNFNNKRGRITEVRTQQGEGYIIGEKVIKSESDNFYVRNGKYTTCDKPHPDFYIEANKLKMVKKGNRIVTGPAYMVIADVPTPLAIPFGFFPANKGRQSGLIFPAYGESNDLGFFLKDGGWYFGFSDYVDLALTGDIYSQGSWALHGTSNYANLYHYRGSLNVNYSTTKISEKELPDYSLSRDFFVRWNHSQDAKAHPGTIFSASVNAGTGKYYYNNISSGTDYLTNTFQSSISYSKRWLGKPYNLSIAARHDQNNITHIYNITLPEIGFGIDRLTPFKRKVVVGGEKWYEKIGLSLTTNARNSISSPDSLLFKPESIDRFQNGIFNSVPLSTSFQVFKYFTISPSINFSSKWYFKTFEQRYDADSEKVFLDTISGFKAANEYSISASLNTRIYGMANFKKGKIAAIRHVVTPSVSLSYRPDYAESKYGYYKNVQINETGSTQQYSIFGGAVPGGIDHDSAIYNGISYNTIYGGPASGKYGFLSFGLDNNLEMKTRQQTDTAVNFKKIKILESLSINTGYNLAVKTFNWSPVAVAARTTILEKFNITANANFDPYAINDSTGDRINRYEKNVTGKLLRFTNARAAIGFNLNSTSLFDKSESENSKTKTTTTSTSGYYKIPWNLTFNYSYDYSKKVASTKTQTLYCYGDLSLTENWKINFSTGWDFEAKDVSYTSLGIVRDLHCWEMHFSWVPFGAQENYFFSINVKSSILKDLKVDKKKDRYDR